MSFPRINITANSDGLLPNSSGDLHQSNPTWVVAFVRFTEPASMYGGSSDLSATKPVMVVENDCVGVNINGSKGSFGKSCVLTLKVTDINYSTALSPGDWVVVWLCDFPEQAETIARRLAEGGDHGKSLCDYHSGLKFVGRVTQVDPNDSIAEQGSRSLTTNVSCQAFVEFATGIYYSYLSRSVVDPGSTTPSGQSSAGQLRNLYAAERVYSNGLNNALTNFADAFLQFFQNTPDRSPDTVIAFLFVIIMGIDRAANTANTLQNIKGTFNDAITVPAEIANILGRKGATKLWQLYSVYLGLQRYDSGDRPENLVPRYQADTAGRFNVFIRSAERCKGFVPYYPPLWDNASMWSILSQYLNPVVNEMFTSIRYNPGGTIGPALTIREQPFGTGLFNAFEQGKVNPNMKISGTADQNRSTPAAAAKRSLQQSDPSAERPDPGQAKANGKDRSLISRLTEQAQSRSRAMYSNLPRWMIDESMITSVRTSASEQNRINFVQVWGRSSGAEFAGIKITPEFFKMSQFLQQNFVADESDITRHGLRPDITDSPFDIIASDTISLAPFWARMRADWKFNGHLKLFGQITMVGVQEPIVEGDNCQVRGIVYHIDSVSHSAVLSSNGKKTWRTVLNVSNGILADSLEDNSRPPTYPIHRGTDRFDTEAPGVGEVQRRTADSTRDSGGEKKG